MKDSSYKVQVLQEEYNKLVKEDEKDFDTMMAHAVLQDYIVDLKYLLERTLALAKKLARRVDRL